VVTFRSVKKNLQGVSLRFALEKFGAGRFRSLKTTNCDGATSNDRRLGRRRVVVGLSLRETTTVKSMRRRANAALVIADRRNVSAITIWKLNYRDDCNALND
jgi:hypothetical protein